MKDALRGLSSHQGDRVVMQADHRPSPPLCGDRRAAGISPALSHQPWELGKDWRCLAELGGSGSQSAGHSVEVKSSDQPPGEPLPPGPTSKDPSRHALGASPRPLAPGARVLPDAPWADPTLQKHLFFGAQLSSHSNSHIQT